MQGVFPVLREQIALQKDNFFLWCPVFLGAGIGLYFFLPVEPPLWVGGGIFALALALLVIGWRLRDHALRPVYFIKVVLMLMVIGFVAAQIRTVLVDAPILQKKIGPVMIKGVIAAIEPLEEGAGVRIILKNLTIEDLPPDQTPANIRLRLRKGEDVTVGQCIRGLGELNPPSGPVVPGGFDFRRHLYFSGIGAVGFLYKAPEIIAQPQSLWARGIEGLRQAIGARITAAMEPQESAVTLALMIGQQKALSEADMQAIRDSGLAHMLSISGLHITLLAGVVFFLARLFMAVIPDFALKHPIKKYAAVAAMIAAVFYMLVAGSTAPTVRSVLMIGVVFLAIILDRSPISLRLVAFAALMILILAPENLVSVSFQMSFAAVAGLIAFFEATRERWSRWNREANWARKGVIYLAGVCVTTVIATSVTTPFAVYHFQKFAFMGVVANVLAVPLLSFMIMPFIVLAFFLMPLGLEGIALAVVGFGVDLILTIAHTASDLPHAVVPFATIPFAAFLLCVMAGLWVILWSGWGKVLAIVPVIGAVAITALHKQPDILVSETHKLVGFYHEGQLFVSNRRADSFTRENWEKYYGLPEGSIVLIDQAGEPFACDPAGCRGVMQGRKVAYVMDPYIAAQECEWADVVIALDPVDNSKCNAAMVVDKFDTWREGSIGIWLSAQNMTVRSASDVSGKRPWVKNMSPRSDEVHKEKQ